MKTIGLVAEGPRDLDMLSAVIDKITGEENTYRYLQPEYEIGFANGTGWKGVWKWCEEHRDCLRDYMFSILPKLDLLVIQMDGDVARKEREVHCECQRALCSVPHDVHPLRCERIVRGECLVRIPCLQHGETADAYADYLNGFLREQLGTMEGLPICLTIPCDSTDAWIVAAYENGDALEMQSVESIENPWENVVAHAKEYHGVRIKNRPNKAKAVYVELVSHVCTNWALVTQRCPQAKKLANRICFLFPQQNAIVE
ncbi:MAG: hypothetical protein RR824_10850 [Clostridia bacterium]